MNRPLPPSSSFGRRYRVGPARDWYCWMDFGLHSFGPTAILARIALANAVDTYHLILEKLAKPSVAP
eukprot:3793702-Pyramimonas_sp.AAC.1